MGDTAHRRLEVEVVRHGSGVGDRFRDRERGCSRCGSIARDRLRSGLGPARRQQRRAGQERGGPRMPVGLRGGLCRRDVAGVEDFEPPAGEAAEVAREGKAPGDDAERHAAGEDVRHGQRQAEDENGRANDDPAAQLCPTPRARPRLTTKIPRGSVAVVTVARDQSAARASSTRSACPSGLTALKTFATRPSESITKVLRAIPSDFLP